MTPSPAVGATVSSAATRPVAAITASTTSNAVTRTARLDAGRGNARTGTLIVDRMARPVIGICTAWERARWSVWDDEAALLPRSYIDATHRAGGMAVLLPPD